MLFVTDYLCGLEVVWSPNILLSDSETDLPIKLPV